MTGRGAGVYLYALVADAPRGPIGHGLAGEALGHLDLGGMWAVAGELPAAPDLSETAVRGHHEVVCRLAEGTSAILPARLGTMAQDAATLAARLAPARAALADALELVAGRVQITLRLCGRERPEGASPPAAGPGTRYLSSRAGLPAAVEPLRRALAGIVRAERAERHRTPPLLASLHHLVERGHEPAYRAAIAAAAPPGLALRTAGPWPPYAFAPGPP